MNSKHPMSLLSTKGHEAHKHKHYSGSASIGREKSEAHNKPREKSETSSAKRKRADNHATWVRIVKERNRDYFIETAENIPEHLKHELLLDASTKLTTFFNKSNVASGELRDYDRQNLRRSPLREEFLGPSTTSFIYGNKKRRRVSDSISEDEDSDQTNVRPAIAADSGLSEPDCIDGLPQERARITLKLYDTARWEQWFLAAFTVIQQQGCRIVAKEWIKLLHPKKQSTHPYNGNMPRNERRSPERTKPPYWPEGVLHKEPDHIDKTARTKLLTHLVMNTPQEEIVPEASKPGQIFTAKDFLAVLEKKQDSHLRDKMSIIRELINARELLESHEGGCYGKNDTEAFLSVTDYEAQLRQGNRNAKSNAQKGKRAEKKGESKPMAANTTIEEDEFDNNVVMDESTASGSASEAEDVNEPDQEDLNESELTTSFSTNAPQEYNVKPKRSMNYCDMQPDFNNYATAAQASDFGITNTNTNHAANYMPQRSQIIGFHRRHTVPINEQFSQHPWQVVDSSIPPYMIQYDNSIPLQQLQNGMMLPMKPDNMLPHRPRGMIPDAMPLNTYDNANTLQYLDACQSENMYLGQVSDMRNTAVTHGYDICHRDDMKAAGGDDESYYRM